VKKESTLFASEMAELKEGRGDEDLRCKVVRILFHRQFPAPVCHRRRELSVEEDMRLE